MRHSLPARGWGAVQDAVEHGIAQIDVARRHVDPGPQHPRTLGEFARAHAAEKVQALGGRSLAPRTVGAGLGQGAPVGANLVL